MGRCGNSACPDALGAFWAIWPVLQGLLEVLVGVTGLSGGVTGVQVLSLPRFVQLGFCSCWDHFQSSVVTAVGAPPIFMNSTSGRSTSADAGTEPVPLHWRAPHLLYPASTAQR